MTNPFGKLKIHRDDEDVEHSYSQSSTTAPQTLQTPKNASLFPFKDNKPKNKVRPEQKTEKEVVAKSEANDNEGFEVVGKTKNTRKNNNEDVVSSVVEEKPGRKDQPKEFHTKRGDQNFRAGGNTRQFDRHVSGTGRGKEIRKEGRGGKFTWEGKGREIVERDDTDYVFNKVLNANPKAEATVTEKVVEKEEVKVEEKVEEKTEVVAEATEDGKDRKKKGKKGEIVEVDEKDKLIIPENAMTLKDYKEKTQKNSTVTKKAAEIKVDLEVIVKNEDDDVLGSGAVKVKKDKKKNKTVDAKEAELNKLIGSTIGFENSNERQYEKKNFKKY